MTNRISFPRKDGRLLTGHEASTLHNALRVAAEKFDANAAELRAVDAAQKADSTAAALFGPGAAASLAEAFDQQAVETRALLDAFVEGPDGEGEPDVWIVVPPE